MHPKTHARSVQKFSYHELGSGVLPLDARHYFTAFLFRQVVQGFRNGQALENTGLF
jgi:hypothetical protein